MRRRSSFLLAGLTVLALPAAASAQVTAQLTPNLAGAGSHLVLEAKGTDAGLRTQQIPTVLAIGFQKGFAFDPTAVAGICSDDQSTKFTCPPNSIVGTGSLQVLAEGPAFGAHGTQFTAGLTLYRAAPRQPGDPMGVVFSFREPSSGFQGASIGRLMSVSDPVFGEQLRFDKLPLPSLPSSFHFTIQDLKLDFGAGASTPPNRVVVKKKRRVKHRSKRPTGYVSDTPRWVGNPAPMTLRPLPGGALMKNPATCTSSWPVQLELDYGSSVEKHGADAPCAP